MAPDQVVVGLDEPAQRADGGPERVELVDREAVRLVGTPEVGDAIEELANDRGIHRLVDPRFRCDPAGIEPRLPAYGMVRTTSPPTSSVQWRRCR